MTRSGSHPAPVGHVEPSWKVVPGWYPDPAGRYDVRWWTGSEWSALTRQGRMSHTDPLLPAGTGSGAVGEELAHLHYVEQFLDRARSEGSISPEVYRVLVGEVAARLEQLATSVAAPPVTAGAGPRVLPGREVSAASVVPSVTPQAPGVPPVTVPAARPAPAPLQPARPRPVPAPGPVRRWRRAVLDSVRSDLAVHGLAYLGVLLLFAGLFGLVAFSFS
jgi:hypothetical protein